jgi:hypothetical protein
LPDGRYLLDAYRISYVSVARDVLRFGPTSGQVPAEPLVVADPDYDLTLGASHLTPVAPRSSRLARALDRGGHHFARLPGTRAEGELTAQRLGVKPLLGETALEGRVKAAVSPHTLHLATHGFFLPDQPLKPDPRGGPAEEFVFVVSTDSPSMENPMLRSGLAVAGANAFLRGAPSRRKPRTVCSPRRTWPASTLSLPS